MVQQYNEVRASELAVINNINNNLPQQQQVTQQDSARWVLDLRVAKQLHQMLSNREQMHCFSLSFGQAAGNNKSNSRLVQ